MHADRAVSLVRDADDVRLAGRHERAACLDATVAVEAEERPSLHVLRDLVRATSALTQHSFKDAANLGVVLIII